MRGFWLEIMWSHDCMMCRVMMFGEIVAAIGFALGPIKVELTLGYAILDPVVTHIKCFGPFHTYLRGEYSMSGGVVSFKGSSGRRLWVTKFKKGGKDGAGLLGTEEYAAGFSFRSRGGNSFNGLAEDMQGTIRCGIRGGEIKTTRHSIGNW